MGAVAAIESKRVLIVEDRYLLADDLARMLRRLGARVVGPVSTVTDALQAVERGEIDLALLDIDLRGTMVFDVADALSRRGVPFAFSTGYARNALPGRYRDVPFLSKPISQHRLRSTLAQLVNIQSDPV